MRLDVQVEPWGLALSSSLTRQQWLLEVALGAHEPLTEIIRDSGFEGALFEAAVFAEGANSRPFQAVLLPSRRLASFARVGQPQIFEEHFERGLDVVSFPSLRRDCELVCPTGMGPLGAGNWGHLVPFVSTACGALVQRWWAVFAARALEHSSQRNCWMSTSGLGVRWLHGRLDRAPKYYQHQPFQCEEV